MATCEAIPAAQLESIQHIYLRIDFFGCYNIIKAKSNIPFLIKACVCI